MISYFECDNGGYAEEYVGCKIIIKDGKVKCLQPVLVKSLVDEFKAGSNGAKTPAPAGQTLQYAEGVERVRKIDNTI